jgi:hypothetical protein
VKIVVQEKIPQGVNDNELTLTGFLFLRALFIEKRLARNNLDGFEEIQL